MTEKSPLRSSYFPAIEKKYEQPMKFWFDKMAKISNLKYPEQITYLKENHGFSQTHANALVMFSRGSKSSRRHDNLASYLESADATKQKTVRKIFKAIIKKYPKMELVIAWNQPMLKLGDNYIIGVSVLKNHLLIAPFSKDVLTKFAKKLTDYKVNKKTIQVPVDWKVDEKLLQDITAARIKEFKN
jgi:uncharacterized protein YdhG (YjbR/CyaY superfamily)